MGTESGKSPVGDMETGQGTGDRLMLGTGDRLMLGTREQETGDRLMLGTREQETD